MSKEVVRTPADDILERHQKEEIIPASREAVSSAYKRGMEVARSGTWSEKVSLSKLSKADGHYYASGQAELIGTQFVRVAPSVYHAVRQHKPEDGVTDVKLALLQQETGSQPFVIAFIDETCITIPEGDSASNLDASDLWRCFVNIDRQLQK